MDSSCLMLFASCVPVLCPWCCCLRWWGFVGDGRILGGSSTAGTSARKGGELCGTLCLFWR